MNTMHLEQLNPFNIGLFIFLPFFMVFFLLIIKHGNPTHHCPQVKWMCWVLGQILVVFYGHATLFSCVGMGLNFI